MIADTLFCKEICRDSVFCFEVYVLRFSAGNTHISFSLFPFRPFILVIASVALQYSGLPGL